MGIMAHGPIHELHLAPPSFKLLNEEHLMHVVASEPVRGSDNHTNKSCSPHLLSQLIKTWSAQFCSAVSIIAKDVLFLPGPSLSLMICSQTLELLFDCLCLCLSLCRNADVDRDVHGDSPGVGRNNCGNVCKFEYVAHQRKRAGYPRANGSWASRRMSDAIMKVSE